MGLFGTSCSQVVPRFANFCFPETHDGGKLAVVCCRMKGFEGNEPTETQESLWDSLLTTRLSLLSYKKPLTSFGLTNQAGQITKVLRPFGHLSVVDFSPSLDANALMLKSLSLHLEMVFTRILHGSDVHRQGSILETIAALVVDGRIRPITTTRLNGLSLDAMRAAHQLVETTRTIGKVVISTAD